MTEQSLWYIYSTINGNNYPIKIGFKKIFTNDILHNYEYITSFCKNGCKNYGIGGGCPPKAPKFDSIVKNNDYAVIVYAKFDSVYKTAKVKASNSPYIHFRFQDGILAKLLTNLGYEVLNNFKEPPLFLNNGYCMGCNNNCSFKSGLNYCSNPQKRTFSLEATGINVAETLDKTFGFRLQWYNKENINKVEYLTKVIGFICNETDIQQNIFSLIQDSLNKLKSTKYKIDTHEYNNKLRELISKKDSATYFNKSNT